MKSILIGLALLCAAPSAFARGHRAENCAPNWVAVTPETGYWAYPCGQNYTVTHGTCVEGEVAYGNEYGPSGELVTTTLVCKNGTFVAPSAPVNHATCREGEIAYDSEYGSSGELVNVTVVCRNGRFVRN